MKQDGDRLNFVDAFFCAMHDTTIGGWEKRYIVFNHNSSVIPGPGEVQLDMPYVQCLEERKYVVRLSNLVRSLKGGSGFSDQGHLYTV